MRGESRGGGGGAGVAQRWAWVRGCRRTAHAVGGGKRIEETPRCEGPCLECRRRSGRRGVGEPSEGSGAVATGGCLHTARSKGGIEKSRGSSKRSSSAWRHGAVTAAAIAAERHCLFFPLLPSPPTGARRPTQRRMWPSSQRLRHAKTEVAVRAFRDAGPPRRPRHHSCRARVPHDERSKEGEAGGPRSAG